MLAALLLLFVAAPQRAPVEVREPLPQVLETLRDGAAAVGFDRALSRLPELLDSPLRGMVEGAAFVAGEYGRVDCRDALVEVLRREEKGLYGANARVRELALDALIRLESPPPLDLLFGGSSPAAPEMLFAALSCERESSRRRDGMRRLFQATAEPEDVHWAAAIELVRERDARVAEALLLQHEWVLSLLVVDPDGVRGMGGRFGGRIACGGRKVWPPYVGCSIALPDVHGDLQSAKVTRWSRERYSNRTSTDSSRFRIDSWRLRLLAELAPRAHPLAVKDLSAATSATDPYSLRLAIDDHAAGFRRHVEQLASELRASGLLRASVDVLGRMRICVELRDARTCPDAKLEAPDPPPGVRIAGIR